MALSYLMNPRKIAGNRLSWRAAPQDAPDCSLTHSGSTRFGDHKHLGGNLFELRFFFGPGFRAYYTIKDRKVVFLLCGGDKSTQARDINKARAVLAELE